MDEYKTTWREKLGYGIGAVGLDLSYGMFYSYLSYYLSSVLGLKGLFAAAHPAGAHLGRH